LVPQGQLDQARLAASVGDSHIEIPPSAWNGMAPTADYRIPAPMYVAPQVAADYVDLNYIFLFAFNGSQIVQWNGEYATLPTFAEHQGDIEGVTVRVSRDLGTVQHVAYEAHGTKTLFPPNEVDFVSG